MVLRSIIHRRMRCVSQDRRGAPPLGKKTVYALYFAIACGFWITFKQFEPAMFPVIKDFTITRVIDSGDSLVIYGEFDKVRDCTFIGVVGYSNEEHVAVVFSKHPRAPVVTRLVRHQTYGPWVLVPKVPQIELYSHHICATGSVTTKMFSGALVL